MIISPRIFLSVAATLLLSLPAVAESVSSKIEPPTALGPGQTHNLFLVGKVWGYLKYHHPTITGGCLDWDEQLLRKLPAMIIATDGDQVTNVLESWIDDLQRPDACAETALSQRHFGPRNDWLLDQELLGTGLVDRMRLLDDSRPTGGQHYVTQQPGVGNPIFQNEPRYSEVDGFDWRYRLLALYRFWNIVEYWFPYRDVIDEDWDKVLADSIPRFYSAESKKDYLLELARFAARINDGHANVRESIYVRPPGGRKLPPFSIRMVEGKPFIWRKYDFVNSDAALSEAVAEDQLLYGDIILKVDGKPVEELFSAALPYIGASNGVSSDRLIAQFLLHGKSDSVSLQVQRDGKVLNITNRRLPREALDLNVQHWHDHDGETFQLLSDEVAYLKLSTIDGSRISEYVNAAHGTKGLVIDVRSYPSSFVVFALGQHLMSTSTPFARFTRGDIAAPGSFLWMDPVVVEPLEPHYEGKVVILVDEDSWSQSEYTAMALRSAPNAVVVGSQTAGSDGNVSQIPLPGGYTAWMSGIGVFYPDKTPTQRIGIVPDIEASPTVAGLRAGRDEVLEVAIRQILGDDVSGGEVRRMAGFARHLVQH